MAVDEEEKTTEILRKIGEEVAKLPDIAKEVAKLPDIENKVESLQETAKIVVKLRSHVQRLGQVASNAGHETRISALETQILELEKSNSEKSGEEMTLKEHVKSFLTNLSEVEKRITDDTKDKVRDNKTQLEDLRKEMTKQKQEWEKEKKDDSKFHELKYYEEEMVQIQREGTKLLKTAEKASIPSKTSVFSAFLGGFINLQTMKQNSEYFWLSIVLSIAMLLGTSLIIVMSAMKLRKAKKDLSKLQTRQEPVYKKIDELIIALQLENLD